jgi:hypothetical protein
MHPRSIQIALLVTGMAAVAPQAARADSLPCLINVVGEQARWTVTKNSDAKDGKVKIYDQEPKYKSGQNVDEAKTPNVAELKDKGAKYSFMKKQNYWIVFFPKDQKVSVRLDFVKGTTDNMTSLLVNGWFHNKFWRAKKNTITEAAPEVNVAYKHPEGKTMNVFTPDNFGKGLTAEGETNKILLTLN